MPTFSRTFRVFVSSTFSDMKAERDALQQYVFPRLRELCLQYDARFQDIDLRWGISHEAVLEQQVIPICLAEIARCQKVSPRPNFIVLLGNRYGARPLPAEIPATEFEQILQRVTAKRKKTLVYNDNLPNQFKGWYRRDDNAVPPVYVLQKSSGKYEDHKVYERVVERPLMHTLMRAVEGLPLSGEARIKYGASVTEQEIVHGALNVPDGVPDPTEHVFCFFRTIHGLPDALSARPYTDLLGECKPDLDAREALAALLSRLRKLLPENIHDYASRWVDGNITLDHIGQLPKTLAECLKLVNDPKAPKTLCVDVFRCLSRIILMEIEQIKRVTHLTEEIGAHEDFGKELARDFIGRTDILPQIRAYVGTPNQHPLAVWGAPGSGKSALMAKAAEEARVAHPQALVIERYIGATPESSSVRALLESLCQQIAVESGDASSVPSDYRELIAEFPRRLARATQGRPLIVFLDALDQLSATNSARSLAWLPVQLPENVHLIVSALPDKTLSTLERRFPISLRLELTQMPRNEGERLLDRWLARSKPQRTLQKAQRKEVMDKFVVHGLPLYLKLAFEEARLWKSYEPVPSLGTKTEDLIKRRFQRLAGGANHGQEMISHSLGYLLAARKGLSEGEMLAALSRDPQVVSEFFRGAQSMPVEIEQSIRAAFAGTEELALLEGDLFTRLGNDLEFCERILERCRENQISFHLPIAIWSRLYFDLEPYLTERSADQARLLGFYHKELRDVAATLYGQTVFHQWLAHYFAQQPLYVTTDETIPNLRKLSELPYQQASGNLWKPLEATLSDLAFLEAKSMAGMAFDLMEDIDRGLVEGNLAELAQVRDTMVSVLPVLLDRPALTLQTLYNRLRWLDSPSSLLRLSLAATRERLERLRFWIETKAPSPTRARQKTPEIRFAVQAQAQSLYASANLLGVASDSGDIALYDLRYGQEVFSRPLPARDVVAIAFVDDGTKVVTMESDGFIRWEGQQGYLPARRGDNQFAYSSSHGVIAVRADDTLVAWQPELGRTQVLRTNVPTPLKVVRASADGQCVLYVAGTGQMVGIVRWTGQAWENRTIALPEDRVLDADLDLHGHHIVLASTKRQLLVLDASSGEPIRVLPYERLEKVILRGLVERCTIGSGQTEGWACMATSEGHLGAWNWQDGHVQRLPDYRSRGEPEQLVVFAALPTMDALLWSTHTRCNLFSPSAVTRQPALHQGPVDQCLLTRSKPELVVSLSEMGQTLGWSTVDGLHFMSKQTCQKPTAIASWGNTHEVIVGSQTGRVWRQRPHEEVTVGDLRQALAERIASLYEVGQGRVLVAGRGSLVQLDLNDERAELCWQSNSFQTLERFLAAGSPMQIWMIHTDERAGKFTTNIVLIRALGREETMWSTNEVLTDAAIADNGATLCVVGNGVRILHRSSSGLLDVYRRDTQASRVAFLGSGHYIAVARSDQPWLEIWRVADGLPTVAAIDVPSNVTSLAARDYTIAVGLRSGDLMSVSCSWFQDLEGPNAGIGGRS